MPRDDWARAKAKDTAKRGRRDSGSSSNRFDQAGPSKAEKRAAKRKRIRSEMRHSANYHAKHCGPAAAPIETGPRVFQLCRGQAVETRRIDADAWRPHVMQRTIRLPLVREVDGYREFSYQGWAIRLQVSSGDG